MLYTPSMPAFSITASYIFTPLEEAELLELRRKLIAFGNVQNLQGLVLIAPEGINATVAGSAEGIVQWKELLTARFGEIIFKDSSAEKNVFRRWSVKIKPEIVGIKNTQLRPNGKRRHLTPEEWQHMLENEDVIVVDARNDYEVTIGKFSGAVNPKISAFHEFPDWVKKSEIPKEKKVLMYCTGGIRCEKALLAMEAEGYDNVYQLEGGILAYLARFPHASFEGECFVFDQRVAVDQHLRPSAIYDICPHCGDPGTLLITCPCGTEQKICTDCSKQNAGETCSKRCRNERKCGV